MNSKQIAIVVLVTLIFVVGISFLLTSGQKPTPSATTYSQTAKEKPVARSTKTFFDFGQIKVSDVKQKDFFLENKGSKSLQILNINSSCGCTTGQIIYNGSTSKEFGMHSQSGFVTEIAPDTRATVRVIYRPASMPVFGVVTREVYITTNDPSNEKMVFSIKANVK